MRVPNEILNCVVFLGLDRGNGYQQAGTAFLLTRQLGVANQMAVYVVTAKHVIDGIRRDSVDGKVYIRLNARTGGTVRAESPIDQWLTDPDDPYLDVAMLAWAPPRERIEYRTLPEDLIATDEVIQAHGIGVGDDLFLAGLFVNHYGRDRNVPIVRVGSIAAMPGEPVQTRFDDAVVSVDAYLVEVRSIGGLSGSPVFVMLHGSGWSAMTNRRQIFLLGLMHGHWDAHFTAADAIILDGLPSEAVNMGIAIVVPASKILDVTNLPQFVAQRQSAAEQARASLQPTEEAEPSPSDSSNGAA